jgi:hypothetical protein
MIGFIVSMIHFHLIAGVLESNLIEFSSVPNEMGGQTVA